MAEPEASDPLRAVPELERDDLVRAVSRQSRVAEFLRSLGEEPPQVLLLEGGDEFSRICMAMFWAARLNCSGARPPDQGSLLGAPQPQAEAPCLRCDGCSQIIMGAHRDLFFLDGRDASIKIDHIRGVRSVLGEAPRGTGSRVIIMSEAQSLTIQAANALLKSLEEPRPGTSFVLLTPQRERLLPTLVSRSWVLTLGWPPSLAAEPGEELAEWLDSLLECMATGCGWMTRTEKRGAVTRRLAMDICLALERDIIRVLTGAQGGEMARRLARLPDKRLRAASLALEQTRDALEAQVNPALTLDWLATRFHLIGR